MSFPYVERLTGSRMSRIPVAGAQTAAKVAGAVGG
jgi:hypothetical protein